MSLNSIQTKLGLLFVAFAILVLVSVGVTFWGIRTQNKDALVINLAGRQRMLVQQMTRLALEIERGADSGTHLDLQKAISTFDQTLVAFQEGGSTPYLSGYSAELPTTNDSEIQVQLAQLALAWASFHDNLDIILGSDPGSQDFQDAILYTEINATNLVQQADLIVRQYEGAAIKKVNRIVWIQGMFLISVLVLLGLGGLITRNSVIAPLGELKKITLQIGEGNLETPVDMTGPIEIQSLSDAFEAMRAQLQTSRSEMLMVANTLEERVDQRTLELKALNEVSREISSHLNINRVLSSVTEKSRQLLSGDAAYLCLLDSQEQFLSLRSSSSPRGAVTRSSTASDAMLPIRILSAEQAMLCGAHECQEVCEIMASPYRTSMVAASLRSGNRVIGALCVGASRENAFSDDKQEILSKLANTAAIALENARLYDKAERSAILEERQILAAEMHDGMTQTLTFTNLMIELALEQIQGQKPEAATGTLERGQRALDQAGREARDMIANFQEDIPKQNTLQNLLATTIDECAQNGHTITWNPERKSPILLSIQDAEQVIRVVREAVLNAQNHSGADHIAVQLKQHNDHYIVVVKDDGIGFDPAHSPDEGERKHFGLSIMRARAARIGGEVKINSRAGEGTQVFLSWPVEKENQGS